MSLSNKNLTNPYGEKGKQYAQTHPGMASWAGAVENKTCRECTHFISAGYYSGKSNGVLKPGTCAEYKKKMGQKGPAFHYGAKACNKFEQADNPPKTRGGFSWA